MQNIKLQSLGAIIDNSMNEVYIFDVESFKFTYVNNEAKRNIGYTLEEMLCMTPVDIKPNHTMQAFLILIEPLLKGREDHLIFETVHQRKDDSTYNVEIRLEIMTVDGLEQFVVIAHNITERILALKELEESEEKFRNITENALMGIFIYQENFLYVNQAFINMCGYSEEELFQKNPWAIVAEPFKDKVREIALRRLKGEIFSKEYTDIHLVKKDSKIIIVRISTKTIQYKGNYAGMGTVIDITDIKETKQKLQLLARAVDQMGELVRITDKDGVITYVNDALTAHTGYTQEELIGKDVSIFKSGEHDKAFYEELWEIILAAKTYRGVFINKKKNQQLYYEEETITPILDEEDNIQYFVATSKDITERVRMEEELQKLANYDSLTGIFNRYRINEEIDIEIARVNRYEGSFALAMIDIDYFKTVNDTYGHDVGDYVLKEFSAIVKEEIRESDRFGRWGGEEFVIILPQIDELKAVYFANKLVEKINKCRFGKGLKVTISIGVTIFKHNDTKQIVLKKVDNALYRAKDNGRNRAEVE